jgi:predicted dehydrogenase
MYARRHSLQAAVDRVLGRFPLAYWLAPHDIDMMIWTARSPVLSVRAGSPDGATTRSSFISATLRFANGAEGVLETSWCVPSTGGRPSNELFTVRGDQGAIEVCGNEQGLCIYGSGSTVCYPDTIQSPCVHGQVEGPYRSLLRHFAGDVRGLWEPLISPREAAQGNRRRTRDRSVLENKG